MDQFERDEDTCPFCKSDFLSVSIGYHTELVDFVRCDNCFAEGPRGPTEDQAHQLWMYRSESGDGADDCLSADPRPTGSYAS